MRIIVADCEPKVRFALRTLLGRRPGLEVVGEAAVAGELPDLVGATRPDLVLLHWRLEEAAPGLLSALHELCPNLRVIVLSARPEVGQPALLTGADAFVCKGDPPEKLLAAIEDVTLCVSPEQWEEQN